MALVGEEIDEKDEVCGAVVSLRAKIDRIQLWTRGKDDVEAINSLGKKFVKLLDVSEEPGIGLEFQVGLTNVRYTTPLIPCSTIQRTNQPPTNSFLSNQAMHRRVMREGIGRAL